MEHTVIALLTDSGRCVGATAYDRERGASRSSRARPSSSRRAASAARSRSPANSWEYTGDGYALAYDIGAALAGPRVHPVSPTGMVWPPSVRGILVTEGVRGEGGVLKNKDGRRFMFDDIPDNYKNQTAKDAEEGLALYARATRPPIAARSADARPRRALHQPRGQGRPWITARRRVPRHRLDSKKSCPTRRRAHQEEAASMYHQFKPAR
jgi:succinate dehydrogenase / fumarate reductase flavoprotein subunit